MRTAEPTNEVNKKTQIIIQMLSFILIGGATYLFLNGAYNEGIKEGMKGTVPNPDSFDAITTDNVVALYAMVFGAMVNAILTYYGTKIANGRPTEKAIKHSAIYGSVNVGVYLLAASILHKNYKETGEIAYYYERSLKPSGESIGYDFLPAIYVLNFALPTLVLGLQAAIRACFSCQETQREPLVSVDSSGSTSPRYGSTLS